MKRQLFRAALAVSAASVLTTTAAAQAPQTAPNCPPGRLGNAAEVHQALNALRTVFEGLSLASTSADVLARVGVPAHERRESTPLGLPKVSLIWQDAWGGRYEAIFIADRMVSKATTSIGVNRVPNGQNP